MTEDDRIRVMQVVWRLSETGGIPQVVRRVVSGWRADEFELHLCTARPFAPEDHLELLESRTQLHSLEIRGPRTLRSRLAGAWRLARVIRQVRPTILHIHSGVTWLAAPTVWVRAYQGPIVVEVHDSPQSGRVSKLNWLAERSVIRRRQATVLVHSGSVAAEVASASGLNPELVRIIPIGLAPHEFVDAQRGDMWRQDHGIAPDRLIVTWLGRLVQTKRPDKFLRLASEAAPVVEDAVFVLAGDGPERQHLEAQALALGLGGRLRLAGSEPDVPGLLSASDLFVSTSDYEGFGMTILEAMAACTAIVAVDSGAVRELVEHDVNGLITNPGDSNGLTKSVIQLLTNPDVRERMASEGAHRAKAEFRVSAMVSRYERLYQTLLTPKSSSCSAGPGQ